MEETGLLIDGKAIEESKETDEMSKQKCRNVDINDPSLGEDEWISIQYNELVNNYHSEFVELQRFFDFFQRRKSQLLTELEYTCQDIKSEWSSDDVYTKSDMFRALDSLKDRCRDCIDTECSLCSRICASYICLFFTRNTLSIESSEHQWRVKLMEKVQHTPMTSTGSSSTNDYPSHFLSPIGERTQSLPSVMGLLPGCPPDEQTIPNPTQRLLDADQHKQADKAESEKPVQHGQDLSLEQTQSLLNLKQQQYRELQLEYNKKISESSIVIDLKKMLQKKNAQIKELKQLCKQV